MPRKKATLPSFKSSSLGSMFVLIGVWLFFMRQMQLVAESPFLERARPNPNERTS